MKEESGIQYLLKRADKPIWSVVIPTYQRLERLFICLHCLLASIKSLGVGVEIVVMDNAPVSGLLKSLRLYLARRTEEVTVIYRHLPSVNQSGLRNEALAFLNQSVENVLFLDSDIYLSSSMLNVCNRFLQQEHEVVAVAPPLVSYFGGQHAAARSRVMGSVRSGGPGIVMPSNYDYSVGRYRSEKFLESLMLRGAFVLRRKFLREVFGDHPWLTIFEVWQNVPFFLRLRELGTIFGYILDPSAVCLNDERWHKDTFGVRRPDWHA